MSVVLAVAATAAHGAASAVSEDTQQSVGYPSLFGLVLLGSILPIVPTGAVVSASAVVAWHLTSPMNLAAVFVVGSLAAYVGDLALYWAAGRGERWLRRLASRVDPERLAWSQKKLTEHRWSTLILSRLMPAGRIPVMVACIVAGLPMRRFATANAGAVVVWCAAYQAIGIATGSLFPEPWEGVVAVCAVVLLVSVVGPRIRSRGGGEGDAARAEG